MALLHESNIGWERRVRSQKRTLRSYILANKKGGLIAPASNCIQKIQNPIMTNPFFVVGLLSSQLVSDQNLHRTVLCQ
ncbi:MAG: hypothetical protein RLZZ511_3000 [Cyanobacteriota bacterium]|jgi:hypothetical protein